MGVPKKRTSKARRDRRRTHDNLAMATFTTCSNCKEPTRPHHICAKCGHYDGKQILNIKE